MIIIRCIYQKVAPSFPATDQHPDALRYGPINRNGETLFIDAIGGEPSMDDIDAMLSPPAPVPQEISDRQFFQQLAIAGTITQAEALAAVKTGTIPASLQAIIDAMPDLNRFNAEMLISGATIFQRAHPLTEALGAAQGMTSGQIDALFRAAAQL